MFGLVAADLRRQWMGVVVIALIVALATALGVAVTLQERALRLGSARAAAAFELIVGAPGSETQLVLSSIFLQPAPLPLVPGKVLAALLADPRVAWAAPIGFGDSAGDSPIIGTTEALVQGIGRLAEGRTFARRGEAVAGSSILNAVGDAFTPLHGRIEEGGSAHAVVRYTVVGRLAPTGTPWDKAILVPIEAVWAIHADEETEQAAGSGRPAEPAAAEKGPDLTAPIDPAALSRPDAPGLPAILVKPRSIADAYKLRVDYRNADTLAVFPAEVLTRLYATLGDARLILSAVTAGAQGLVAAAILFVVTLHVMQRRRQIGALRAFGAPRPVVFAVVWLEAFLIVGAGMLAGFAIGYGAVRIFSGMIATRSGFMLPVELRGEDALTLGLMLAATAAASLLPAALAYRQSPANALRA